MITEVKSKPASKKSNIRSYKKVKDYGNELFFVKKAEEANAFLYKHPFPKELIHKK